MLEGLMQHDHPLTLQHVLWRMRTMNGDARGGHAHRGRRRRARRYAEVAERVDRLRTRWPRLGVEPGDRVATFAWNTQRHLELYLAVPCIGAVLHTLNIRLFPEQLDLHRQPRPGQGACSSTTRSCRCSSAVAPTFETVEHYVVMGDGDAGSLPNVLRYEELLAEQDAGFDYPELDDRAGRRPLLHERDDRQPEGRPLLAPLEHPALDGQVPGRRRWASARGDRVLPVVPMFHANAWGFPYACALGAPTW